MSNNVGSTSQSVSPENLLRRMTLREKIGQCFTVGFNDDFLRPEVVHAVRKLNCGGLRLVPWEREGTAYKKGEDRCFKGGGIYEPGGRRMGSAVYLTPTQYAALLNELQQMAIRRPCGIPLHFSIDQEGDSYNDYTRGGVNLFPSNMGLMALKNPDKVYQTFVAIGRQLRALGVHFIHSPVLEVNLNPDNPEMNFRCFSDDPGVVAEMGVHALRGLRDGGVIAVAKHFPGRGDSDKDTHYEFCIYGHNAQQMHDIELRPYRALIAAGLESIMTAHTVYPALGDSERPATVSRTIVTDVLRKQMGFEGIITTDSITMLGLMNKYGLAEACLMALEAGNDLVLYRGFVRDLPAVFDHIEAAVEKGRTDVAILEQAITRMLKMKAKLGLLQRPMIDLEQVEKPLRDPEVIRLSEELPAQTALWVKKPAMLPLTPTTRVLLVEQLNRFSWQCNDLWYHPGMLYEAMLANSNFGPIEVVEATMTGQDDLPRIKDRIAKADVVVATSFYCRTTVHNYPLIQDIVALGKPVIAVTNNPYLCKKLMIADGVLQIFSGNPNGLKALADILYGRKQPGGTWPLTAYPQPKPE